MPREGLASQFSGFARYNPFRNAPPPSHSNSSPANGSTPASRATNMGLGLGNMSGGLGRGGKVFKRHKKVHRDTIHAITKGDIRRMARRGGVKRISGDVYEGMRTALKQRLEIILRDVVAVVDCTGRKTVSVQDVIFTLNRLGRPLYGFDPSYTGRR